MRIYDPVFKFLIKALTSNNITERIKMDAVNRHFCL